MCYLPPEWMTGGGLRISNVRCKCRKENAVGGSARGQGKLRGNYSTANILANRSNILAVYTNDAHDGEQAKRGLYRNVQEQSFTLMKPRKTP